MPEDVSRREFLRTGAVVASAAAAAPAVALGAPEEGDTPKSMPRRKLGRAGVEVPILSLGGSQKLNDRMLNTVYDEGVHHIDTAGCYEEGNSEKAIGAWFKKTGHRKDVFLVTKDHPKSPDQWIQMLDLRREALQIDQIDLFFIHGLGADGDHGYPDEGGKDWPKSKEWAVAVEKMKESGKTRFVGFSTHCRPIERGIALLNNAAQGGWVDAIMLVAAPQLIRENAEFNKALDTCYKAGVGLISMKETRGGLAHIKEIYPEFEAKGLTPHTAVLHAVWSDERFVSICSHMDTIKKLTENAEAARSFKPMTEDEQASVHRMLRGHRRTFCHGCDGSCRRAAGTETAFNDIARYLSYYEEDGRRAEARALFAALTPEQRDWSGADLCAASQACVSSLDFPDILDRAGKKLA